MPLIERVENWFAAPEVNAAGRMGLYRILYGLWYLWLLLSTMITSIGNRPAPPFEPIGVMKVITLTPFIDNPAALAYGLGLLLTFAIVTLTMGLATRLSTGVILVCSVVLFTWDSSFDKVIDKFTLMGSIVPLFMVFSRWGDTYSIDALIKRKLGQITPLPSETSWEYIWPQRAIVIFVAVHYFSAGYTKLFEGTWSYNPYVVLDKLTTELLATWATKPDRFNDLLYMAVLSVPAFFVVGQYLSLVFEFGFPLALINNKFRTLMFASAAIFHTSTLLILDIGFSSMIIVLAIIVDWQAVYDWVWQRLRRSQPRWENPSAASLTALILFTLILAALASQFVISQTPMNKWDASLIDQKSVWLLIAPFAVIAAIRSAWAIFNDLRARLQPPHSDAPINT